MSIRKRLEAYHIEVQHIIVLFIIGLVFQMSLSFINNQSTNRLFKSSMDYYRKDSAERVADLTTTSLELLIENSRNLAPFNIETREDVVLSFDKLLSQQKLQRNIDEVYLLIDTYDSIIVVSDGNAIFDLYLGEGHIHDNVVDSAARKAMDHYTEHYLTLMEEEQIVSILEGNNTFFVLVPFYDRGEISGAAYMEITPEISGILNLLKSAYNQSSLLFIGLILMGFMAMFFIYSYTARERDQVQQQLFDQRANQIKQEIEHQKESLFTKRIYHTHHKAEKVMGFIKEDLRELSEPNLDEVRARTTKYANFVSRVIYDMKSYDPPTHVIRNPMFRTDINEVIAFIVKNIFHRVYREGQTNAVVIDQDLAQNLPILHVNEYVIWEIIEPLIQNAIDHNAGRSLHIDIRTRLDSAGQAILIDICDNGVGFPDELLAIDADGVKMLFRESVSTKEGVSNSGYGCYLSREISRRCGWELDANNNAGGGACFTIRAKLG